jgi:hypothetical protein
MLAKATQEPQSYWFFTGDTRPKRTNTQNKVSLLVAVYFIHVVIGKSM